MNKGLYIKVIDRHYRDKCAIGEIAIGDFYESFEMELDWWSLEGYVLQWQQGLLRLKDYDNSCLVTSIDNPQKRAYINWWLLYKEDGIVYIQNQIIIGEIYKEMIGTKPFTVDNCYDFIPTKYISDDEDEKVSEWCVRYSDIDL